MSRLFINRLIWLYFLLLIFEGVLRKWVLPGFSDILLLARDPLVILIYILAFSRNLIPPSRIMIGIVAIAAVSVILSLFFTEAPLLVIGYGVKANFLHLPLIFIIPKVLSPTDTVKMGRWLLIFSIPMIFIMALQFQSGPDDFWNYGPGATPNSQIRGGHGHIRPPGYFSFITGVAQFLSIVTAFVLYGFLKKNAYRMVLLISAGVAVVLSAAISSSRLALGSIGLVFLALGVAYFFNRKLPSLTVRLLVPAGLILLVVTNLDIYEEGKIVFENRLDETGDLEATWSERATSWTERMFGDIIGSYHATLEAPFFGYGLGMGTNVGARVVSGRLFFQLAEGEWSRIIMESGVIAGYFYLALRTTIAVFLFRQAIRETRRDNILPLLLFGSCFFLILFGQFGQATTLGFAVLGAGLTLAACTPRTPRKRRGRHRVHRHVINTQPDFET